MRCLGPALAARSLPLPLPSRPSASNTWSPPRVLLLPAPLSSAHSAAQKFRLVSAGGNYYKIVDAWGRCVDVPNNSNGVQLYMYQCHDGDNQKFWFETTSAKYVYRLRPKSSNRCVGISQSSTSASAPLIQWDCVAGCADQLVSLYNF